MKKSILFSALTLLAFNCLNAQNLLTNGGFENGGNNVGFNVNGNGYTELLAPFSGTTAAGNYAFTTNPLPLNTNSFIAGGDHPSGAAAGIGTGSGNMMVIDGNNTGGNQRFWRAGTNGAGLSNLIVGATYQFSYWIKSVATTVTDVATQANIGLQFTNTSAAVLISGVTLAPLPALGWQRVVYTFKPTTTSVFIELWNTNTSFVGNDFGIDDFLPIVHDIDHDDTLDVGNLLKVDVSLAVAVGVLCVLGEVSPVRITRV